MKTLLEEIQKNSHCRLIPPLSSFRSALNLPNDLKAFYSICNGVELFLNCDCGYRILGLDEMQRTDLSLLGECPTLGISVNWFNIAKNQNGEYLTIDLSHQKMGYCYDAFYETYGLIGNMPIIAHSFTELLYCLFQNQGQSLYWQTNDFSQLYDYLSEY